MPKLSTVGFTPPPDFPVEAYNEVHQCLNKYNNTHRVQWKLFGLGWNGLAYRYRAMAEYNEEFVNSVKVSGGFPPPEERYKQGKALFGFFINATSLIDCFFFSTYCMASIIKSKEFPLLKSKELKFYPEDVSSLFTKYFNGDDLTKKINKCLNADDYKQMKMMRDVLSHRGTPPRNFYSGGERNGMVTMPINIKAPSNQWQYNFLVDEKTTTKFSEWLSGTLKELVESSVYFCTQQLS